MAKKIVDTHLEDQVLLYPVPKGMQANKYFFDNGIKLNTVKVLGIFYNEHKELFVVYRIIDTGFENMTYVTGSELDWEVGLCFLGGCAVKLHTLSKVEQQGIKSIIGSTNRRNK